MFSPWGLYLHRPSARSHVRDHTDTAIETFGVVIDNFKILTTPNSDVNQGMATTPAALSVTGK
jgi:hypothetical protein